MRNKVFFSLVDTLAMGGTERMSVNVAGVMDEEGWESHLIVSRRGGGLENHLPKGIQVHFLNKRSFYDLAAFWRLVRLIAKHRPRILHAHSTSIYWAVVLKVFVGRFLLVWHDHFGLSDQLERYPRKEMVVLSKWIDRIVVVNEKLERYWKGIFAYRSQDIRFLGNFPWINLSKNGKYGKFTFLNLANFRAQKDQLTLIRAAKMLAESRADFRVLLVGELVDAEWVGHVRDEILSAGLEGVVELVGPATDVAPFLAQSHVGILSSESEGLPVALLEFGLSALPVIVTKVGDCAKVVSSDDLGWCVPPKDPSALAMAMASTMSDYPMASRCGEMLQRRVEKEFGKTVFVESYWELLGIEKHDFS